MTPLQALAVAVFAGVVAHAMVGCGSSAATAVDPPADPDAGDAADPTVTDDAAPPDGGATTCPAPPAPDPLLGQRDICKFAAGARALDTLGGITADQRRALPIKHIIVVTQENRSFDHYFGTLSKGAQPDAEGWPAGFTNPDKLGAAVAPYPLGSTCLVADPPHQGAAMLAGWNAGQMNGFVTSADTSTDGHHVMGYYDAKTLPFYHWLASTFAMSDRYFGAALAGTWGNRDYLYAATSDGVTDTGGKKISVPTIFDALDTAKVTWGVYTDGTPRQDCLGWTASHVGVHKFPALLAALADGTLPAITFVDPGPGQDEHPPANVQDGEAWTRSIYEAAVASPLWKELAIFFTYDESGGLADHVPPPHACIPSADQTAFDRLGIRVPFIAISPWARGHFVSHAVHSHTSILRFVELVFDLPALTARDANSDALLDLFDFACGPALTAPPAAPLAGTGGCP